jgi:hypothetical protein
MFCMLSCMYTTCVQYVVPANQAIEIVRNDSKQHDRSNCKSHLIVVLQLCRVYLISYATLAAGSTKYAQPRRTAFDRDR